LPLKKPSALFVICMSFSVIVATSDYYVLLSNVIPIGKAFPCLYIIVLATRSSV
jgi:hypothetical protein